MIDNKIIDKKNCMGCYACQNICPVKCITMESDEEGFWYPFVDYNKCTECGLCIKSCPIINKVIIQNNPEAYACINNQESIRLDSSSGGIFTLIAEDIINNGGVVFGACFDENFLVVHKYVETINELKELRGSKYVQSKIGETYKQAKAFLKQGRLVLFSGTPCQIGGLKSYIQLDYDNLICIDIICHGVPSPKVWSKYVLFRENIANSKSSKVVFRQKRKGWKRFEISFSFNNSKRYHKSHVGDLYMQAFLRNVCLRPSCYACEFKTLHRQSDITLADFWGIKNILPEMDDDKGTSLIFINSDKGINMFQKIKSKMLYQKVNISEAIKYNTAAIKSVNHNKGREYFFNDLDLLTFDKLAKKYFSDKFIVKIKLKIRAVAGQILRRTGTINIVNKILKREN